MIYIAGPCTWDNDEQLEKDLIKLKSFIGDDKNQFYFKSSFLKDNRSEHNSYKGPGEDGIKTLLKLKQKYDVKICTDFHTPEQIYKYGSKFDIIQIPAFLCKQTSLLEAAAANCKLIHIKKAQWMHPQEIDGSVCKIKYINPNVRVIVTDRGTYGINNQLYMDPRHVYQFRNQTSANLIGVDITHSNKGHKERFLTAFQDSSITAITYKEAGCDVIFMETTEKPLFAMCDADTMLDLAEAELIYDMTKDTE